MTQPEPFARPLTPIETIHDDALYSVEQIMDYLGLSRGALATMRYEGRGPKWTKVSGKVIKYRGKDLREWLDTRVRSRTSGEMAA